MRSIRIVICVSILMLASLACKTIAGQGVTQTEAPAAAAETAVLPAPIETVEATSTTQAFVTATPADAPELASGLGIALENVRGVMESTQQFNFTDGSIEGQPAVIASLTTDAATSMPGLADQFSAVFLGDPADLGEIRITVPYSDDETAIQTGLGMVTLLFSSILPPEALFSFIPWITENYSSIPQGGSEELVVNNLKFTIARIQAVVILSILPVK